MSADQLQSIDRIDASAIRDTTDTINFTTVNGSEFRVLHFPARGLSLGWYRIERMGVTGTEFLPLASFPESADLEIVVGEQVVGRDLVGAQFRTSHVVEIRRFISAVTA